jgi:hypothetical protein
MYSLFDWSEIWGGLQFLVYKMVKVLFIAIKFIDIDQINILSLLVYFDYAVDFCDGKLPKQL